MVTVKVSETYDLKTTKGKLGIIGIHTPRGEEIRRLYPGLVKSHKFIRFKKCDVVGVCAQTLPADPLQVGVESGNVAPEDLFNPILYKAVTNTSFDTLVSRVMNAQKDVSQLGSVAYSEETLAENIAFNFYYSLLSESGEYRKAMPQKGFRMSGLVPLCHTLVSTYGNLAPSGNVEVLGVDGETPVSVPELTEVMETNDAWTETNRVSEAITFRGKSVKMPKFPIHTTSEAWDAIPYLNTPKTMVGALIIPPARLHEFWYRMRVTWYISFENICSTLTAGSWSALNQIGASYGYGRNYTIPSSKMMNEEATVDTNDVEITKIMES